MEELVEATASDSPRRTQDGGAGYHHGITHAIQVFCDATTEQVLRAGCATQTAVGEVEGFLTATRTAVARCDEVVSRGAVLTEGLTAARDRLDAADHRTKALEARLDQGASIAAAIQRAASELDQLSGMASLLAIYVDIESSRLPAGHQTVGALAEELRSFAVAVREVALTVANSATAAGDGFVMQATALARQRREGEAVRGELADIAGAIDSAWRQTDTARETVLAAGELAGGAVLARSFAALSALQYQDPMAQRAQEVDVLAAGMCAVVRGSPVEPLRWPPKMGDGLAECDGGGVAAADQGELLLF